MVESCLNTGNSVAGTSGLGPGISCPGGTRAGTCLDAPGILEKYLEPPIRKVVYVKLQCHRVARVGQRQQGCRSRPLRTLWPALLISLLLITDAGGAPSCREDAAMRSGGMPRSEWQSLAASDLADVIRQADDESPRWFPAAACSLLVARLPCSLHSATGLLDADPSAASRPRHDRSSRKCI